MSLIIDGVTYNIGIVSLKRKGDFLDKFAERTNDGVLHRELIGVYFNYQLTLGNSRDCSNYQALWDKLTEPTEFHSVTVPDGVSGTYTFTAYFASVADGLAKTKEGHNYWTGLTVNFIAQAPART